MIPPARTSGFATWVSRRAPSLLLVAVLVAGFLVVLGIGLALGAALGATTDHFGPTGFDQDVTAWLVRHRDNTLTSAAKLVNVLGDTATVVTLSLAAAAILAVKRHRLVAGLVIISTGATIALVHILKVLEQRSRPPSQVQLVHETDPAFPSGHATQTVVLLLVIALVVTTLTPGRDRYHVTVWASSTVVAIAVGCARVYLGTHWITDVVAGWLLGAAWVCVLAALLPVALELKLGERREQPGGTGGVHRQYDRPGRESDPDRCFVVNGTQ